MIEPSARRRPWVAAVGNHEVERPGTSGGFARPGQEADGLGYEAFTSRFPIPDHGVPGAAPTFGTFRYAGVRFVLLDNNDVCAEFDVNRGHTRGRQALWLQRTLADAAGDPSLDAVVAVMHQPAFSSAIGHGSDLGVRRAWHDLFVRYGVTLVLQGHGHLYERTEPIAGTAEGPVVAADGVTYITCRNGGSAQRGAADVARPDWSASRDDRDAGVVRVEVIPAGSAGRPQLVVSHHPVGAPDHPTDEVTIVARHRAPRSAPARP